MNGGFLVSSVLFSDNGTLLGGAPTPFPITYLCRIHIFSIKSHRKQIHPVIFPSMIIPSSNEIH